MLYVMPWKKFELLFAKLGLNALRFGFVSNVAVPRVTGIGVRLGGLLVPSAGEPASPPPLPQPDRIPRVKRATQRGIVIRMVVLGLLDRRRDGTPMEYAS